ncbi:hypothetical protein RHMOL_Rhmol13G0109400 [Rhododendron molle]|uniref:Uncharacterized protein n=1 Tax=Rhododendron molle TaxID=49168 RepID=A0ACC0L5V5_RHOML|nr:hypothetical protein RHMOL_Rhmol13G0109400 [Rhododendron molle]
MVVLQTVVNGLGWDPPPSVGQFKLNTDGAFKPNLRSGVASGLIRDGNGDWIVGFQRRIGAASFSATVEIDVENCWALSYDLQLALKFNLLGAFLWRPIL